VHALLAIVALATAACGSTVQRNGTELVQHQIGGGPLAAGTGAVGATGGEPAAGSGGPVGGDGTQASVPGGTDGSTAGTAGPAATGPLTGRGFTADAVRVGFAVQGTKDPGASLGLNVDTGDQRAMVTALVSSVNSRGGIGGRNVVPVFYETSASPDVNVTAQAACASWTEDDHVAFAVSPSGFINDTLLQCLANRDTPLFASGQIAFDQTDMDNYGAYLYLPSIVNQTRVASAWITRLQANGWAASGAKVALLRTNEPRDERFAAAVRTALAANGLALADEVVFPNELNGALAQMNSAVLRLRNEGITHILGANPGALFFMTAAEQQGFRPRYGLTSDDALGLLLEPSAPPAQLHGALAIGWMPGIDVTAAHDPGDMQGESACRDTLSAAGQHPAARAGEWVAQIFCDAFLLAERAGAAGDLTTAGLQRGVESVGTDFASALTFASRYGAGRHDGGAAVRDVAYDDACRCFEYFGAPTPL
jgi:ABC-type branched-subunit amino acid transport system substrate-binding protein